MVKEHRYLIDMQDIDSLVFTCTKCQHEVVCKLDGTFSPADYCVSCRGPLADTGKTGPHPARELLTNIRRLLRTADPTVNVRLVIPAEPPSD